MVLHTARSTKNHNERRPTGKPQRGIESLLGRCTLCCSSITHSSAGSSAELRVAGHHGRIVEVKEWFDRGVTVQTLGPGM